MGLNTTTKPTSPYWTGKTRLTKLTKKALISALTRLNIPEKIIKVIENIYDAPTFNVVSTSGSSTIRPQESGIRRGCPLSPYLFVIVISVVMHDIHAKVGLQLKRGQIKGFPFSGILYADDTLLVCKNDMTTNIYLRQMILESSKYNMELNNDKCESLVFNGASKVKFLDSTNMKQVSQLI